MVPKWFTPIIIAAAAGVSVWLLSEQAPTKPRLIALDNSVPDAYMENIKTYIMNEHGKPRYELHANYMAHYTFDDHSDFISPQFIYYRADKSEWVMTSERGTVKDGTEQIILHGKVTMVRRQLGAGDPDLKIDTSELLIRPEDSYAETDQLITITSGEHRIQSNGIRAYFNDGRVELLSRVRGVYAL